MLEVFGPLFDHYSVDAVVTGHIHAYERTQPVTGGLMTGLPDPNGAVHLTVVPDMIVNCLDCGHRFTI